LEPRFGSLELDCEDLTASWYAGKGKEAGKVGQIAHLPEALGAQREGGLQGRKNLHRRRRRGRQSSKFITTCPLRDVNTTVRFSNYSKPAMKQMVLCLLASGGQRYWSFFATAGDKINAATYYQLQRQDMDP
jgi:hypothetical protein